MYTDAAAYETGLDTALADAVRRTGAARAFADRALADHADVTRAFAMASGAGGETLSPLPGLPPVVGGSAADVAALESAASLYFAQELEAAGLLRAAEGLAALFRSGALGMGAGSGAQALDAFWRARRDRASPGERAAAYARLFGGGEGGVTYAATDADNPAFESLLLDLAEAMHRLRTIEPLRSAAAEQSRIGVAVKALATNLLPRAGGAALFLAEDALAALRQAVAIMKHPEIQSTLGVRGLWAAVRRALGLVADRTRRDDRRLARIGPHFDRARSGLRLIGWLADSLPRGQTAPPPLRRDAGILDQGTLWLQATLALLELLEQGTAHA